MSVKKVQLSSFMEKDYSDPREIPVAQRKHVFTKEELFAILNKAIKNEKKVYFVAKNWLVLNWLSWHIPLELKEDKNIVVVKGWTRGGQIMDKTIESIVGVFISTESSDLYDIHSYADIKKLREAPEHTNQTAYTALDEIQTKWKQFRYMRKGLNGKGYRTTPKTIIKLTDTYVIYWSTKDGKAMFRTIPLNRIWHIQQLNAKANKDLIMSFNQR